MIRTREVEFDTNMSPLQITSRKYHAIFFAVLCALALFGIYAATIRSAHAESSVVSADEHIITLHDDGIERGFITGAKTLRAALQEADIRLDENDRTEPGLDEPLVAPSYEVNIYRARPVIIRDGSSETKVITAYRTGEQIAKQADISLQDEDVIALTPSRDIIADGAAEIMTIDRATPFTFVFYGKTTQSYTQATTVAEMLKEKSITMTAADVAQPSGSTPIVAGMTISLWRNGIQTVTHEEDIAFETEQVRDVNRERGYKEVKTPGVNGKRTVTYEINMLNGVEVSRKEINSNVTTQPVKQVEIIGAKGSFTTPSENEKITWGFLISQGFSREQTAGIMGNLKQEHGFRTDGDGLAQWTGGRKAALMALPDPYNIYTQLEFMMSELNGRYSGAKNAILVSTTVEAATIAFQNKYEGCGICVQDRRIQYAYDILASH